MTTLIEALEARFAANHDAALALARQLGDEFLFKRPAGLENAFLPASPGDHIVRSAAAVEQVFGGLTTRLWDDPFEWTLPEELSNVERVSAYLAEVAAYRAKSILFFSDDAELFKEIPAPEEQRPIISVLLDALARSSENLGKAEAISVMLRYSYGADGARNETTL